MADESDTPLWDLPTRLFHWVLALAIFLSWWSHEFDNIDVHRYAGYTSLVLIVFRIIWGFVGSARSRFSDFLRGPRTILAYLRGADVGSPGHNPLGGWSVMAFLCLVLAQAGTGLFNSDGILFDGPFYNAVSGATSDRLGELHATLFTPLQVLIAVHIAVVLFYQLRKRRDLLRPMITGYSSSRPGARPLRSWWWAGLIVALLALTLYVAIGMAPEPESYW